jgi:hypothetical protein
MSQVVLCRRLHRWFLIAMWMERTSKVVLDELRFKDQYTEWVARAAAQERLLVSAASQEQIDTSRVSVPDLVAEHCAWTECSIDIDSAEWAEEAGFHSIGNLKMELGAKPAGFELLADSTSGDEQSCARAGNLPGSRRSLHDQDPPPHGYRHAVSGRGLTIPLRATYTPSFSAGS